MQNKRVSWRKVLPWVRAFRPPAQINLALPMLVGMLHAAPWSAYTLLQGLGISLLLQAMILYSNDASDAATDDPAQRTWISGGSGVGADASLSPQALRCAALSAGAVGLLACYALGAAPLAGAWLAACALVWAYDGRSLRLSRHPLGCACQAVGVGVITPLLGAWLVAAPSWPSLNNLLIGLGLGVSGHLLSALPDARVDRRVGKITVVVWLGARTSFALLLLGLAVAAAVLLWPQLQQRSAVAVGVAVLLGCAWCLRESIDSSTTTGGLRDLRPGNMTLEVWFAGLLTLTLWIGWIAG
jgi:1,4-dihydroxy-2-naphthoate octaprenyltransferase